MTNLHGGSLVLTGAWQQLSDNGLGMRYITVRNNTGNTTLGLAKSPTEQIGFLKAEETKTFYGIRPMDVWVSGVAGQLIYWDGQTG